MGGLVCWFVSLLVGLLVCWFVCCFACLGFNFVFKNAGFLGLGFSFGAFEVGIFELQTLGRCNTWDVNVCIVEGGRLWWGVKDPWISQQFHASG